MKHREKLRKRACAVIAMMMAALLTGGCEHSTTPKTDDDNAEVDASILTHDARLKTALRDGNEILFARVAEIINTEAASDQQITRYRLGPERDSYAPFPTGEYDSKKSDRNIIVSSGKSTIRLTPGKPYLLIIGNGKSISGGIALVDAIPMTSNKEIRRRLRSRIHELWRELIQETSFPDRVLEYYLRQDGTTILDVQVLSRRTVAAGTRSQSQSYIVKVNRVLHGAIEATPLAIGHYGDPLLELSRRYVVIVNMQRNAITAPGVQFIDRLALANSNGDATVARLSIRIHRIADLDSQDKP